ncbi:MAG: AIR synthase family protein [Firmicutes bacterium]|nr:AIR synthase family protein [Bacillota bacterium]
MLKIGKLDSEVLQRIVIDKISYRRPEVKTRAGVGEDCAVIDYGEYECVISTDPITASVNDIGRLAIHISCNDIASNGIEPLGITLAVLLPDGTTREDVKNIMAQAGEAAEAIGVEIIGGHTEVTPAVNQPVIVSTAFGRGVAGESAPSTQMQPGDWILMTKSAGLEGTGIIASDKASELEGILTEEEMNHAKELLNQVSVVKEGIAAGKVGTSGMHDVTEGGILGAVWELCHLEGMGCEVWEDQVAIDPVTVKIAAHYGIDPLRLISSGSMIIMASDERKDAIVKAVEAEGISISCIGRIRPAEEGVIIKRISGETCEITPPEADELYKVV